jgi:hypothetical protein
MLTRCVQSLSDLLKDLVSTMVRSAVDGATKDEPAHLAEVFAQLEL